MPGQKPELDLQPKAQARLPDAAVEALTSSDGRIPFILDELDGLEEVLAAAAAAAAAGEAGHGPDDPHNLLGILTSRPGQGGAHVTFMGDEDRVEVTPDRGQACSHVPEWMDLG